MESKTKEQLAQEWVDSCIWSTDEKDDAGLIVFQVKTGFRSSFLAGYNASEARVKELERLDEQITNMEAHFNVSRDDFND